MRQIHAYHIILRLTKWPSSVNVLRWGAWLCDRSLSIFIITCGAGLESIMCRYRVTRERTCSVYTKHYLRTNTMCARRVRKDTIYQKGRLRCGAPQIVQTQRMCVVMPLVARTQHNSKPNRFAGERPASFVLGRLRIGSGDRPQSALRY